MEEGTQPPKKTVTLIRSADFQGFLVLLNKPEEQEGRAKTIWIDPILEDTPHVAPIPGVPQFFIKWLRDPGSAFYFSTPSSTSESNKEENETQPLLRSSTKKENQEDGPQLPRQVDVILTSGYDHTHLGTLELMRRKSMVPSGILITTDKLNEAKVKRLGYTNVCPVTIGQPAHLFFKPRKVVIDAETGESWWGNDASSPPEKNDRNPRLLVKAIGGPIDLVVHIVEDEETGVVILYAPHNLTRLAFDWVREHTTHIDVLIILGAEFRLQSPLMRWMSISATLDEGYNYIKTLAKEKDVRYVVEVHQKGVDLEFAGWFKAIATVIRVGAWDDFVQRAEKDEEFPKECKFLNPLMGEIIELNLD